jgi:predicted transposase YbfD/YdcC
MQALLSIFREVHDPREFNARHDLPAMLFVALAATLCGAKSCVEIAEFAEANEAELAEIVPLPHGAPSHDCFSRVFRLLDPAELAQAFARFATSLREALGLPPSGGVVAIDGKRLRRGYERGKAHMPPLLVSVWDAETRLSLAACAAPAGADPGNEVAATLAGLRTVMLKGCLVTADALHCHPAMAAAVLEREADYALKLKANHGPLFACAEAAFAAAERGGELAFAETSERGHDRVERRRASVIARPAGAPAFPGLTALGRIESERRMSDGKLSHKVHYVALSRLLPPARLLEVMRAHWSVENHLHRELDIVFHEDDARTRKDFAPQNLGVIRRLALDILRAHPDSRPVARKINLARWNKGFFYELFTHMQ